MVVGAHLPSQYSEDREFRTSLGYCEATMNNLRPCHKNKPKQTTFPKTKQTPSPKSQMVMQQNELFLSLAIKSHKSSNLYICVSSSAIRRLDSSITGSSSSSHVVTSIHDQHHLLDMTCRWTFIVLRLSQKNHTGDLF